MSRYARWIEEEKRREVWPETVARYFDFFEVHLKETCNYKLTKKLREELENSVLNLEVMPSMRALMTAGPALNRCNVAGFNCAYLPVDTPRAFDETMYILMCGTGVGFSVERQFISKLPEVASHFEDSDTTLVVRDSKSGWARAFKELISLLYAGQVPCWNLSRLRPAGARLKTFGGRSSGPDPLAALFTFTVDTFKSAIGRKLTSLECHDIMCKVGEVIVMGGVRRSALISLSNLTDDRMRHAKSGEWWNNNGQRSLANNSVAYTERPTTQSFMNEWSSLYASKSGERGIFNRQAAIKKVLSNDRRDGEFQFGTNPCGEIILRPNQFCNLSEVVVRPDDTLESLMRKVRVASILGTFQSTLTNFKYLRPVWSRNTEEERLLGVSLTGIMDHPVLSGVSSPNTIWKYAGTLGEALIELRYHCIYANKLFADKLGIEQSTATTCIKPSGTVAKLVDSRSGIHTGYGRYILQTIRGDNNDPLTQLLIEQGVKNEQDVTAPNSTTVFYFPLETPESTVLRKDRTALDQLRIWKIYQDHWCEHNPSCTIYVKENEWISVGAWIWENFDDIAGITFLPYSDHTYRQAPYNEITKEEYDIAVDSFPDSINWSRLSTFEEEDHTVGSQEFACTGESCEVVDIGVK